MLPSSRLIRVMPQRINPVEIKQGHEGIMKEPGQKRIPRKRSPGERPYAVIKTVFKSAHTMVTTIERVHAKMIFAALSFNICLIRTFKHLGVISGCHPV